MLKKNALEVNERLVVYYPTTWIVTLQTVPNIPKISEISGSAPIFFKPSDVWSQSLMSQFVIWGTGEYTSHLDMSNQNKAVNSPQTLLTELRNQYCHVFYLLHAILLEFHCLLARGKTWGYGTIYVAQTLKFDRSWGSA